MLVSGCDCPIRQHWLAERIMDITKDLRLWYVCSSQSQWGFYEQPGGVDRVASTAERRGFARCC